MIFFSILILLISFGVRAEECADLVKCVELVSKISGKKYIYDKEIKGGIHSSSNIQLNAENAEVLFTRILNLNGYVRIPTAIKDTYSISALADIRYETLPTINVDMQTPPSLPQNDDYYLMTYNFKNYNNGQVRETTNLLRPFMSRYGRVIELKTKGALIIQENASKLNQLYDIIKSNDRVLSKAEIQLMKEHEIKQEKREELERKHKMNSDTKVKK